LAYETSAGNTGKLNAASRSMRGERRMKKHIRVGLTLAKPLHLVIAVISSILACFPVRCLAADPPTVLVVAQGGVEEQAVVMVSRDTALLFYLQDAKPIGIDYLAKDTELAVDSAQDDRLFVRYKDKPAYVKKDDVRPKEGSLGAEQLFKASAENPEEKLIPFGGEWITEQVKFRRVQTTNGLVEYKGNWVTPETKANLEKGLVLYKDNWMTPEVAQSISQSDHQERQAQQEQARQPEAQQQQAEVLADLVHKAFSLWSEGKTRECVAVLRDYSGPFAAETAKVREMYANTYESAAAPKPPAETQQASSSPQQPPSASVREDRSALIPIQ
jgi:hypothetical protein